MSRFQGWVLSRRMLHWYRWQSLAVFVAITILDLIEIASIPTLVWVDVVGLLLRKIFSLYAVLLVVVRTFWPNVLLRLRHVVGMYVCWLTWRRVGLSRLDAKGLRKVCRLGLRKTRTGREWAAFDLSRSKLTST